MVAPVHVASKYYIRPDEQCSHWVGVYSYAIIRCMVPPSVSLWSHICKGILEIPQLQCTPLVLISWIGMGIRVYARRQGTTFWFILYRTMYVSLFNYNILTDIPIPVDIVPSPNPNILLSSAVPPSSSLSTVYTTISPNHILPPHLCSYTPSRSKTKS